MGKFKVGDRVMFYGFGWKPSNGQYYASADPCVVDGPFQLGSVGGFLLVINPISKREYVVHEKQCYRLTRKPKPKPLRVDGECEWAMSDGMVVPCSAGTVPILTNSAFRQFIGKRTRITVEVIDE